MDETRIDELISVYRDGLLNETIRFRPEGQYAEGSFHVPRM